MDRPIAAAVRLRDHDTEIVAAHGAVSGEIDGHGKSVTRLPLGLNSRRFTLALVGFKTAGGIWGRV
jgi:hypothetical protein